MSKIFRVMLIAAYGALFTQYLRLTLRARRTKDSIELEYVFRAPGTLKQILKEMKKHKFNVTKINTSFKKPERLPTDLKYILKWTQAFTHYTIANGQALFIENKCKHYNCHLTNDKSLLVDPRYFDAIIFDVENNWDDYSVLRTSHQKFIFAASESASNYPICNPNFDSYYNLTWSYKLDSDILWSYITILDKKGNTVGPKMNMTWIEPMKPTSETVVKRFVHKKKAAAWFVSNCKTQSKRENIARKLKDALSKYKLKIDIYGWCGELTCPRDHNEECLEMLESVYYFYLAFENSLSEDYVTEKLLQPLRHFTVPIVYGGANYSRFLPPGSYINAGELNAKDVAKLINDAMKSNKVYRDYFRWHNHYVYKESPKIADVCTLCKILNEPLRETVVKNFRKWWHSGYEEECKNEPSFKSEHYAKDAQTNK